ncbi:MAG: hypothetical protein QOG45_1686 [Chloroflexota bacterium]|nr:hypothetical protein [Chloroflexota bacterium]
MTGTLRIGSLVLCNDYRHPALLAQEAATLDLLSGGRFELGLGAGFHRDEYASAGIPFERHGARVERLGESIRLLKALFGDGPATDAGSHYAVSGLDGFPKPVQRPHPPLLVAGNGRRTVETAAREADILNLMPVSTTSGSVVDDPSGRLPPVMEERIAWVRQAAGERIDRLELSTGMVLRVTDDRLGAAEAVMRERRWQGVSPEQVLEMPTVFIGTISRIVEELHCRRERYGLSYYVVPRDALDEAAPIVERVTGA